MKMLNNLTWGRSVRLLLVLMTLAGSAAACGSTSTSASTVSAVNITGAIPAVGSSTQLTATAMLGDGSTQDVTSLATWQSSSNQLAAVSSTGVLTALSSGTVIVQATYSGVTGATTVNIP
jgi:hypothetical protein